MVEFGREHRIRHIVCGKVIMAMSDEQLPFLAKLFQRCQALLKTANWWTIF